MAKRHNPRLAKPSQSYTISEAAALFKVAESTIYKWLRNGLPRIDKKRPVLIHGSALRAYVAGLNPPRHPMKPGEVYCVACRRVRRPAGSIVSVEERGPATVDIVGECPSCGRTIYRRTRIVELQDKLGPLRFAS